MYAVVVFGKAVMCAVLSMAVFAAACLDGCVHWVVSYVAVFAMMSCLGVFAVNIKAVFAAALSMFADAEGGLCLILVTCLRCAFHFDWS